MGDVEYRASNKWRPKHVGWKETAVQNSKIIYINPANGSSLAAGAGAGAATGAGAGDGELPIPEKRSSIIPVLPLVVELLLVLLLFIIIMLLFCAGAGDAELKSNPPSRSSMEPVLAGAGALVVAPAFQVTVVSV